MKRAFLKPMAVSFVLLGAVLANADVLLDTYGATGTGFDPNNGWTVASFQSMAIEFSVTGTYQLSEIDVPMFGGTDGKSNVNLCTDNAGAPGTVLETLSADSSAATVDFALSSITHPTLTTGNYFITLTPADGATDAAWCFNSDSTLGDMIFSGDSGSSWNQFNDIVGAVRVKASPVPEPASMAALGLGALALVRRRRTAK